MCSTRAWTSRIGRMRQSDLHMGRARGGCSSYHAVRSSLAARIAVPGVRPRTFKTNVLPLMYLPSCTTEYAARTNIWVSAKPIVYLCMQPPPHRPAQQHHAALRSAKPGDASCNALSSARTIYLTKPPPVHIATHTPNQQDKTTTDPQQPTSPRSSPPPTSALPRTPPHRQKQAVSLAPAHFVES